MVEIEKPRIECIENPGDNSYGKVHVSSLWSAAMAPRWATLCAGFCCPLCPVLQSPASRSPGYSMSSATIPGVKEDVTEIVLNVKGIIAKLYSEGTKTVYIEASGEGEVTAGDIKADSEVEILNPEHCTLPPWGRTPR